MSALGIKPLGTLATEELHRRSVWEKGREIPGLDPRVWRADRYGSRLKYEDHGNRNSLYGWEIDHYPIPLALGGPNTLDNLEPLHCKSNASLGGKLGNALGLGNSLLRK